MSAANNSPERQSERLQRALSGSPAQTLAASIDAAYPWREMPDKPQETEQTPKGLTVPVPNRDEFFGNLKKAGKPERVEPRPASGKQG